MSGYFFDVRLCHNQEQCYEKLVNANGSLLGSRLCSEERNLAQRGEAQADIAFRDG